MLIPFLIIIMIIAAIAALEMKDLLSSVIAVGAVGLTLSIAFLVLKAPDLAITQLVVEILCLIILIRATLKKDLPFAATGRWFFNTLVAVIFGVTFLALGFFCLKDLPEFGSPIMKVAKVYIDTGLASTGATNIVASIILDFRAYDTLGEATILFTTVIAVIAVMRKIGRKDVGEKIDGEE